MRVTLGPHGELKMWVGAGHPRAHEQRRRIILDWGRCHELLDALQIEVGQPTLSLRLAWLIKLVTKQVGWPSGEAPRCYWEPLESERKDDMLRWRKRRTADWLGKRGSPRRRKGRRKPP